MSVPAPSDNRQRSWVRGLRPLLWWLLLFLVLYGIRLNEQLLEQTRLFYSISLNSQPLPYDVAITFDGRPIISGENIPLGNHRFEITGKNTDPFATNLFIWYGRHDLGEIRLKRSMARCRSMPTRRHRPLPSAARNIRQTSRTVQAQF